MLTGLFMLWTMFIIWKRGFRSHAIDFRYSWKEKFQSIPKIAPFLFIIVGVMYSLYGGVATPSEAAGVGAALCLFLAILIYRLWKPDQIWLILRDTMRESVMILTIIAAAVLFGYMLTSLYLTQTLAQAIADVHVNQWVLMFLINIFLLVCGFFIPPAAIILMTSPILLPIITAAGFDPVWFGVILTINMEIGLIHPPVGLNIYIVNAIAPDVPLTKVMWGTLPYVICMMLAIVILCIFPEIATWLPNHLMGVGKYSAADAVRELDEHLVFRGTAADDFRARPRVARRATGAAIRSARSESLVELCEDLLSGRGEASGVALAREILDRYAELTTGPRIAFFEALAQRFGTDTDAHGEGDRRLARNAVRREPPPKCMPPPSRAGRSCSAGSISRPAAPPRWCACASS